MAEYVLVGDRTVGLGSAKGKKVDPVADTFLPWARPDPFPPFLYLAFPRFLSICGGGYIPRFSL